MTWLRNLAHSWATIRVSNEAKDLRNDLVTAQAAAQRLKQERDAARGAYHAARQANGYLSGTGVQHDLAEARRLQERAEKQRDELRDKYMTLLETWEQQQPVIELAKWWRSYDHAPDPDPEVWARAESALKRAIDNLPETAGADDGWGDVVSAGLGTDTDRRPL